MIKNIVFDMGMVLMQFDPMKSCQQVVDDPALQRELYLAVFASPEWIINDIGYLSLEETIAQVQRRIAKPELNDAIAFCFKNWIEHSLYPIPGMAELVGELKAAGYGIYLCSNASKQMAANHDCIAGAQHFDGMFFSSQVMLIKPQKEMYAAFFDRFDLKPEECFFVDDLPVNIQGARDCGMDGYCFADGDIAALRKVLIEKARSPL